MTLSSVAVTMPKSNLFALYHQYEACRNIYQGIWRRQ